MGSDELTFWVAFHQLCPFGPERGDLQAAIVAAATASAWGAKVTPADFMPDFSGLRKKAREKKRRRMTAAESVDWARELTRAMGGALRVKENGDGH